MNAIILEILCFETDDESLEDEETLYSVDEDTSSSENGEVEEALLLSLIYRKESQSAASQKEFLYKNIPNMNNDVFKSHFRMYPETFEYVLSLIGSKLNSTNYSAGRKPIAAREQLLLAIWIMATPDSYRSVCEKFSIKKATAIRAVSRTTAALYSLAPQFIQWPKGEEAMRVMEDIERYSGFPQTVGAIDGTHIKIPVPKEDKQSYINRKSFTSVQVQAVCTRNLLFTSVFAGNAGSVHDARVFRLSPVRGYLGQEDYFPNDSHIVGDAAYGIHPNIMVPYKDNGHLTLRQKNFNFCLSSARMCIERAFGIWKARWRRIRDCLPMIKIEKIPEFLLATCVLHNICILKGDLVPYPRMLRTTRRSVLTDQQARTAGIAKRQRITDALIIRHA